MLKIHGISTITEEILDILHDLANSVGETKGEEIVVVDIYNDDGYLLDEIICHTGKCRCGYCND